MNVFHHDQNDFDVPHVVPCKMQLIYFTPLFAKMQVDTLLHITFFLIAQTAHIKNSHVVTYCLLCRWANYILQPLYSESCHQETIAIALPQLVFKVISRFCCL